MMTNLKGLQGFLSHQPVIILEEANESRNVKQSGGQVWSVEVILLQDSWPPKDKQLKYLQRILQTTKSHWQMLCLIYSSQNKRLWTLLPPEEFRSFLALICLKSLCLSDERKQVKKHYPNRTIQSVTVIPLDKPSTSTNTSIHRIAESWKVLGRKGPLEVI